MRTIASTSGSHVTGVTINDYQVKRAKYHNQRVSSRGAQARVARSCWLIASESSQGRS